MIFASKASDGVAFKKKIVFQEAIFSFELIFQRVSLFQRSKFGVKGSVFGAKGSNFGAKGSDFGVKGSIFGTRPKCGKFSKIRDKDRWRRPEKIGEFF